jgi:hypothetical protein
MQLTTMGTEIIKFLAWRKGEIFGSMDGSCFFLLESVSEKTEEGTGEEKRDRRK